MKKKFINGLLMVALFVGFTSSMVSCKDYDDEKITDLEGVLADNVDALKKALAQQKTDLENQITIVKNLQKQCQENCSINFVKVNEKFNNYLLNADFADSVNNYLSNYYTKTQINQMIADSLDKYVRKDALAKSIATLIYDQEKVLIDALNTNIAAYNKANGIINEDSIKKIISDSIQKVVVEMKRVEGIAQTAKELAEKNSIRLDGLDGLVATLRSDVDGIFTRLGKAEQDIIDVRADVKMVQDKAELNGRMIDTLKANYKALDQRVKELDKKVDEQVKALTNLINKNTERIDSLADVVKKNKEEADSIAKELEKQIAGLGERIDGIDKTLLELREDIDNNTLAILLLADFVDKMITGIEINGTYNPMFGELATPFNTRSNMLVVFHGTIEDRLLDFPSRNSDFYAFGGDPQEVFTNKDLEMLGAAGDITALNGYFEITKPQDIVANEMFDKFGRKVASEDEGYAGTIYLTVNPTNRDFTGTEFSLINSLNEDVKVSLSPLEKSNKKLTFGYTRAGVNDGEEGELQSPNGFYETKVTVTSENAKEMGLRIDLDNVKDVVNNLKDWKNGIQLTPLVNAIYNNINNLLDASALKGTWQSADTTFSTISQYAIGVAGVKPLSFAFAKDIVLDGIPGANLAEDLLSNIIDIIVEGLPEMDFVNRFDIQELRLDELTDDLYGTITVDLGDRHIESTGPKTATFWFPTYRITGTNGERVTITGTHPEVTVTVTGGGEEDGNAEIHVKLWMGDFIKYMGSYDSESLPNIRKQFNQLLVQVNDFVKTITNLNFQSMGNDVLAEFRDFINELNTHFDRFTHPNRFFQPAVIVKNAEKMVHLSTLANYPAKVTGPFVIIPSNFNAEILSPAFKKFIGVTDVIKGKESAKKGNAECLAILNAANKTPGINQVINGGFNPILFDGQVGYTYEFLYTAVDYSGLIVTKKFYMTVK